MILRNVIVNVKAKEMSIGKIREKTSELDAVVRKDHGYDRVDPFHSPSCPNLFFLFLLLVDPGGDVRVTSNLGLANDRGMVLHLRT